MTCGATLSAMSETTGGRAYARLAQLVRARRKALRLTQELVNERGGPSTATLRLIEAGKPTDFRRGTTDQLEKALEWATGSVAAVLDGGDPVPSQGGAPTPRSESVGGRPQDDGVLLSVPAGALEGLSPAEQEEALAAAKASFLQRAREIRRRIDDETRDR